MKKLLVLIFIILSNLFYSQTVGGRMKEIKNQRILRRTIFKSGWKDRKWQPNHLKKIELDRKLFFRHRTNNERQKEIIQRKINRKRERIRMRVRNQFHKRKYT